MQSLRLSRLDGCFWLPCIGSFLDQPLNVIPLIWFFPIINTVAAAAAAKLLQLCPAL